MSNLESLLFKSFVYLDTDQKIPGRQAPQGFSKKSMNLKTGLT